MTDACRSSYADMAMRRPGKGSTKPANVKVCEQSREREFGLLMMSLLTLFIDSCDQLRQQITRPNRVAKARKLKA